MSMWGNRLNCWNTIPIFWRCLSMSVLGSVMSVPSKKMCPLVGSSSRFRHLRKVLLPEPEGPTTKTTSPLWISTVIPFKTSMEPKLFPRSCTRIKGCPLNIPVLPLILSQPPFQYLYQLCKYHYNDEINNGNRNQRHICTVCPASDDVPALGQILDSNVAGYRSLL